MGQQVPSVGRIVHFVLDAAAGESKIGQHRPAIIVDVSAEGPELQVFTSVYDELSSLKRTWVQYDETASIPGTWHWPEFVSPVNAPTAVVPAAQVAELREMVGTLPGEMPGELPASEDMTRFLAERETPGVAASRASKKAYQATKGRRRAVARGSSLT